MTRIAQDASCAVLVLHHLRKGSNGTPDDLMGATSLRATFRSCRILMRMTADEGEKMGIQKETWRYIRIAGSKENYAPPPNKATWYRLSSVNLDNGAGIYPDGDEVAVAATWQPPAIFGGIDGPMMKRMFHEIRTGLPDGEWHSPHRNSSKRWVGLVIMFATDKLASQAALIVKQWIDSGVLEVGKYTSPSRREEVERVVLNEKIAEEILRQMLSQRPGDVD
jgi:hypothetical protein